MPYPGVTDLFQKLRKEREAGGGRGGRKEGRRRRNKRDLG